MSAENQLKKSNSEISYISSIRQQVFNALKKNPLLTCKSLCKLMDLDYKRHRQYVYNLQSEWRSNYKNSLGLKRLNFHNWHGKVFAPEGLDREAAVVGGWIRTRARNRYLMWKDSELGRLEWFETGTIKVVVYKPVNKGKMLQLLANAFLKTGLIFDLRVFEAFARTVKLKGASVVFETHERLPYMKIELFRESNGIVIRLGDRSHPTAVEVDFCLPDWVERNEGLLGKATELLERFVMVVPSSSCTVDYAR